MRKAVLLLYLIPAFLMAQQQVTGVVKSNSENLAGVSVVEKGTTNGATTDANGEFQISVGENAVLEFAFVGFVTKEVTVGNQSSLTVILEDDVQTLAGVKLVGFSDVNSQARRRASVVQDLPESTVTLTEVAIENAGITNVQTFADNIPNLQFAQSQNVGVNFLTVRGIPQIRNGDAPVAFVIDGIIIPDANLLNQELFDVAMIEVVKGPQGTLYGKNAIAGAVNVISQKPGNDFLGKVKATTGNGNLFAGNVNLNIPLVKDKVFLRTSALYRSFGGLIENTHLNKMIDERQQQYYRGQLDFKFTDEFSALLLGQYSREDGKGPNYAHAPLNDPNNPQEILDLENLNDVIDAGDLGDAYLNNTFTALKLKYDSDDMYYQSVTSYNDSERFHEGDLDFTPAGLEGRNPTTFLSDYNTTTFGTPRSILALYQKQTSGSKVFNQEIRIGTSGDQKLSWDLGGFFQRSEKAFISYEGLFPEVVGVDFVNIYTTFAAFAFADYKVNDKLNISVGLRFDNDGIEQDNKKLEKTFTDSKSILQPKASIAYKITEDNMLFANYGLGYRNAGFNGKPSNLYGLKYDEETSHNFELGLKNSFLQDRIILNLAGFYTLMNNQQQYRFTFFNGENVIGNFNFDETSVLGFEADFKFRVNQYLDILGSYGYTKATIEKGGSVGVVQVVDGKVTETQRDLSIYDNNSVPMVPLQNFNIGLESAFDINQSWGFLANVNLNHVGEIHWHEDNEAVSPGYNLVNGRIGFEYNKMYKFSLWARNLLDKRYYQEVYAGTESATGWRTNPVLPGDLGWRGQPRAFGIDLSVSF